MKTIKFVILYALLLIVFNSSAQPLKYRNSIFLTITIQTTQDAINRLVPEPFVPNQEGILLFNVGELKIEGAFNYNELFIFIPCELNGKKGYFAPYIYMDNFWGIIFGRDVWGFNKIPADFTSQKSDNDLNYEISVFGQNIIDLNYKFGESLPVPATPDYLFYTLKKIPSAEDGSPEVNQVVSVPFLNARYLSYQKGEAQVEFFDITDGGMGELPVLKVIDATYSTIDFDLPFGKIEIDYNLNKLK